MFSIWKQEKVTTSLIEEAQTLSDKLAAAKPHVLDRHTAAAQFLGSFPPVEWSKPVRADGLETHGCRPICRRDRDEDRDPAQAA